MRQGTSQFLILDRTIVVVGRKYRSKWLKISCMCSGYRRKDGSCKHERMVMDMLPDDVRVRARIEPNELENGNG